MKICSNCLIKKNDNEFPEETKHNYCFECLQLNERTPYERTTEGKNEIMKRLKMERETGQSIIGVKWKR